MRLPAATGPGGMPGRVFRVAALLLSVALGGCAVLDKQVPAWTEYGDPAALKLEYTRRGAGKPVLLIHGFGASQYSWRHIVEPLSRGYDVIALDLKGFGRSPKPRDDRYSVYEQARLVRDFVVGHGLEDVTLVGHSYGGGVALVASLYLSRFDPSLQKGLAIIDGIAYPQALPGFMEILATPMLGPMVITLVPEAAQVRSLLKTVYYDDSAVPQEAVDEYARALESPDAKYAAIMTARQIVPGDLDVLTAQYNTLTMPALVVWSRDDEIIPPDMGRRLHANLPASELVLLEGVGHAPQEEAPELLLPPLRAFLQRVYGAPAAGAGPLSAD